MTVHTLADIAASGFLVTPPTNTMARWVKLTASAAGSRVGDTTVDSTHGSVLASGVPYELPMNGADPADLYNLGQIKVFISSGSISVTYGI